MDKMPCLGAYAPSGIRNHDPLITSREYVPLNHSAPTVLHVDLSLSEMTEFINYIYDSNYCLCMAEYHWRTGGGGGACPPK